MYTIKNSPFFIFLICFLFSCNSTTQKQVKNKSALSYAKRFTITKEENSTILEILGSKNDSLVTATFVLYSGKKPSNHSNAYFIKTPISKVASMSSIYTSMLIKLGVDKTIIAIDNIDYYTNISIQQAVKQKRILELSKVPNLDIEQTIALNPDLIFTFGMGNPANDIDKKIIQANIPVAVSLDHLEETPLARAEWIKFFACFFNKENLADSLFKITEKNYLELKKLTINKTNKPTVLTEIKYSDTWYVPGGKSYVANLLKDAGASYFWENEKQTGSIPLPFEAVYAKAKDCDIWLNLFQINTKKELLSYDERYGLFNAFKANKIYNNNKIQNSKGYSNFWESGIINPDEILADLITIVSPDLSPNHKLLFYKQIE